MRSTVYFCTLLKIILEESAFFQHFFLKNWCFSASWHSFLQIFKHLTANVTEGFYLRIFFWCWYWCQQLFQSSSFVSQLVFTAVIAVLSVAATMQFIASACCQWDCTLRSCFRQLYSQPFNAVIDDLIIHRRRIRRRSSHRTSGKSLLRSREEQLYTPTESS